METAPKSPERATFYSTGRNPVKLDKSFPYFHIFTSFFFQLIREKAHNILPMRALIEPFWNMI